jgi:hypothetical protein
MSVAPTQVDGTPREAKFGTRAFVAALIIFTASWIGGLLTGGYFVVSEVVHSI